MFHRSDWNGDGKLSFDEFAAPTRAVFERLDRDGTGVALCSARRSAADERAAAAPRAALPEQQPQQRHRRISRGRGGFCAEFDLNRDGKVTHAELDKALHQQFQAATKGGQSMTLDQFYALELAHYREMDARIFQHMNTSYTGKLTLQEYAASEAQVLCAPRQERRRRDHRRRIVERRGAGGNTRVAKSGR